MKVQFLSHPDSGKEDQTIPNRRSPESSKIPKGKILLLNSPGGLHFITY
jgi:hypothetical protein